MKKLIALLLTIASMFSFFIYYGDERREQQSYMEKAEENLKYSMKIIIPSKIDSKPDAESLSKMKKVLDKYNGSIYYKRLTKEAEVQSVYIYVNDNEYLSKFKIENGRTIDKNDMNTDNFLSTKNTGKNNQVGIISTFCKENEFEIYTLNSLIKNKYSLSGECYVSFNQKINKDIFIQDLERELDVVGIQVAESQSIQSGTKSNEIIILIVYFIVMLLVLYDLLKSNKMIGVEKLLGVSTGRIFLDRIIALLKLFIVTSLGSSIVLSIIKFNTFNYYVRTFLLKIGYINVVLGIIFLFICSLPLLYINQISISDMLKNKKLTSEILVFNFFIKIVLITIGILIVSTGVNNYDKIKNVFSDSFKQWEDVKDYAIIPSLINISGDELESKEFKENQKCIYKYFNERGGILADFSEYTPGNRAMRLSETKWDYERDNVIVNPNYLNRYPVYDLNGEQVYISEDDESYIVLIPEKYKKYENQIIKLFNSWKSVGLTGKDDAQKNKLIWIKDNQKLFSMLIDVNPEENNYVQDPIIHVMTENNSAGFNYDVVMGIDNSPFKIKVENYKSPEDTIVPILKEYGYDKNINKILCIGEQVASEGKSVKNLMSILLIGIFISLFSIILVIVQNISNFFDKYQKKIAIRKLIGYTMLDKYKEYFIISLISWILVFITHLVLNKVEIYLVCVSMLIGIIFESILSVLILMYIDKKRVTTVIKEGI